VQTAPRRQFFVRRNAIRLYDFSMTTNPAPKGPWTHRVLVYFFTVLFGGQSGRE